MRKKAVSPATRREAARKLAESGLCSIRSACRILRLAGSTYRYQGKPPSEHQKAMHCRMAKLSERHSRYRYRRIVAWLRQEG